jgi:hypothetical protein
MYQPSRHASLEELVKMPIPYESANHPPLPSVDDIKRVGGNERVCMIGEFVIKKGRLIVWLP